MTQWKEEFDNNYGNLFDGEDKIYEEVKTFISSQLEKLIDEAEFAYSSNTKIKEVTKQLKDKWL